METLIVLRGISGSGKSTFTNMVKKSFPNLVHCSADFYFEGPGGYKFDASKLSEAHGQCFRTAIHAMIERASMVVVDNTNTTLIELAPYVQAGKAFGYNVQIAQMICSPEQASQRNVHGVPSYSVNQQYSRFETTPHYYPETQTFGRRKLGENLWSPDITQEQVDAWLQSL